MQTEFLTAIAVATVAGLMRGFAGVGSGMLMAPVFAILFGPIETVAIIVLMEGVVTVQLIPSVWRRIDWRIIGALGSVAALFMPLGSYVLTTVDTAVMSRAMAAIVLVLAIVLMTGWRYEGEKRLTATMAVGAISGTMMAATSLGNPPVMLYLLSSRDPAANNRANFTGYFAVTLTVLLIWMTGAGLIRSSSIWHAALLLPGFAGAAWLGARLFRKSSEALYRNLALGLLVCIGVFGLIR